MSSQALRQFRLRQDGLELVVTPNKSGQSVYDDALAKEDLLSERPSLYGVCITSPKYTRGDFRIVYKASSNLLQPLRIWQNTDYDFALAVPHSRTDFIAQAKESANPIYPFTNLELSGFLSFNSPFACRETADGYVLTGRFNFKEFSGLVNLDIETPRDRMLFAVEVMTAKLSYESDFVFLIEELSRLHSEIILNLDTPVSVGMDFDHEREISPHALMLHIRRLFRDDQLPCSVATILSNPNCRFKTVVGKEMSAFVTKPCLTSLATKPFLHNWIKGGPLQNNFYGFTPETLPSRETKVHYNTVENQFVKAFLNRLAYSMEDLIETLPAKYTTSHLNLTKWQSQLMQWNSHPFWEEVSDITVVPNSMVLMEREGYRELYLSCLSFDLALKYERKSMEPVGHGQLKPVWALYQLWCYFQLYDTVKAITGVTGTPGLGAVFNHDLFNLSIKEGTNSAVTFTFKNADQKAVIIKLYCNRTFTRTKLKNEWAEVYSGFYHPDFSIEIIFDNHCHWLHFDAKYKLDIKQWQHELATEDTKTANGLSIKQDHPNLDKVHSYRDAILGTRGSYILFPGHSHKKLIYVRHADPAYRTNLPGPSIGAFPLRPTRNIDVLSKQTENIQMSIESFLHQIYLSIGYTEENGFK